MADRAAGTDTKLDDQLVPLVRKSLKILVVVGGALFVLQNMEVDVGSLLTGLGIGGLAFALAAKETLANFFGSIMIFVDRPFQIGDWVVVKGAEGIVEEVGFRSTRVRTFYNSVITVPNAHFTDAQIDNYGKRQYRRVFTTLNLTYDTTPEQMQAFCEGVRAIIRANEFTRKDYYEVHMSAFGAHSLDVMVYFFFRVPSWSDELRERHNVFLEIMRLAKSLGVQFAFPTQTLNVDYVHALGQSRNLPDVPDDRALADNVVAFGPKGKQSRPRGPTIVEGGFSAIGAEGADEDG
jgi:MscS family membrane protein